MVLYCSSVQTWNLVLRWDISNSLMLYCHWMSIRNEQFPVQRNTDIDTLTITHNDTCCMHLAILLNRIRVRAADCHRMCVFLVFVLIRHTTIFRRTSGWQNAHDDDRNRLCWPFYRAAGMLATTATKIRRASRYHLQPEESAKLTLVSCAQCTQHTQHNTK